MISKSIFVIWILIPAFYFQRFLSGSDNKKITIWNEYQYEDFYISQYKINDIIIDKENNIILACSLDSQILIWNFTTKEFILSSSTSKSVSTISSLNKTHFVAGLTTSIGIYSKEGLLKKYYLNNLDIKQIKYLKDDQKILIASLKIIVVFCPNTQNYVEKTLDLEVWSLDALNRNFIAAACKSNWICIYKLDISNKLVEYQKDAKTFNEKNTYIDKKIYAIKIINETFIVFGADVSILGVWNLRDESISIYPSKSIILSTEKINNEEFIYGTIDGFIYRVKFSQPSNHIQVNSASLVKINVLKLFNESKLNNDNTFLNEENTSVVSSSTSLVNLNDQTNSIEHVVLTPYDISTNIRISYSNSVSHNSASSSIEKQTLLNFWTNSNILYTSSISNEIKKHSIYTLTGKVQSELSTHKQIYITIDNIEMILEYFKQNIDFNDCIKNCSGHGKCKQLDNLKYSCECFENYAGSSCQLNTIPCSSNPCRNNGTCNNNLINKTYTCECYSSNNQTSSFYGQNCENKIDICLNHSCSSNGICNDENSEAKCKCFKGYSGDLCTIESSEVKTIKTMIRTASIIAIIVLILTYGIIIFNDIATLFCNDSSEEPKINKKVKIKYTYNN